MAVEVAYGTVHFAAQIKFFRDKLNITTAAWDELLGAAHARAFTIAGAMKEDLLADFRDSVETAIEEGQTLDQFRKSFDQIVEKHGWSYNGSRGWRTRVIYETNVRTSYAAGRYTQLVHFPYWRYRHSIAVAIPRETHLAWDGMILPADDPWWKTHYPPNGWGCRCRVEGISKGGLEGFGKTEPDTAPAVHRGKDGQIVGIDKGWDYNVGEAGLAVVK